MEEKPNKVYEERNATLDDDLEIRDEGQLQDELLEESGMNGFQKYIARMDDKKWNTVQICAGAVMGVIAAIALFWDEVIGKADQTNTSLFTAPLVVAIVIAMIMPNIIEKQGLRRAPKLRIALVIALLAGIILYIGFMLISKRF